jgi:hypothetical protein
VRAAWWPPGGQTAGAAQEGARITGRPRRARCFPGGHKDSAGEAGTRGRPAAREKISGRRGERSERPVAGTDAAAQADQAGRHAARTLDLVPACYGQDSDDAPADVAAASVQDMPSVLQPVRTFSTTIKGTLSARQLGPSPAGSHAGAAKVTKRDRDPARGKEPPEAGRVAGGPPATGRQPAASYGREPAGRGRLPPVGFPAAAGRRFSLQRANGHRACKNWPGRPPRAGHSLAAQDHSKGRSLRSRRLLAQAQTLDCDLSRQDLGAYREDGGRAGQTAHQTTAWPVRCR